MGAERSACPLIGQHKSGFAAVRNATIGHRSSHSKRINALRWQTIFHGNYDRQRFFGPLANRQQLAPQSSSKQTNAPE
jgi:hypothetical protein